MIRSWPRIGTADRVLMVAALIMVIGFLQRTNARLREELDRLREARRPVHKGRGKPPCLRVEGAMSLMFGVLEMGW
jgi:hypothetical protein